MTFYGCKCDDCTQIKEEKKDGWQYTCNAFPNGIPSQFMLYGEKGEGIICNNNYGYEIAES